MLYIVRQNDEYTFGWHVGQVPPPIGAREVGEVQADGDELELIKKLGEGFVGYISNFHVVTFFGDHAKFIAANIVKCS